MNDDTERRDTMVASGADDQTTARMARSCSFCENTNAHEREVCRICGADLETGDALPWPEPDPDPQLLDHRIMSAPHPRRWWLAIAAVLAAGGIVLLGLVIAEVGPFAEPTTLPAAYFDASMYPGDPQPLLLSDIATVTSLPPIDGRAFEAARMVDDDPETAWRSDGLQDDPDLPLEIIDLFLDEAAWVSRFVIRNGDQMDAAAYEDVGRVQRVRATVDGGRVYLLNLLDEGRGQQAIVLPQPALTAVVRLEILDVFAGSHSDGIAVSDLELRGWTAVGGDVQRAEERAELAPATEPPSQAIGRLPVLGRR